MKRKIFKIVLVCLLILFVAVQIYFDFQVRKLNGGVVSEVLTQADLLKKEFPDQVKDYINSSNTSAQSGGTATKTP